jgi:hypothetical protein
LCDTLAGKQDCRGDHPTWRLTVDAVEVRTFGDEQGGAGFRVWDLLSRFCGFVV